jgi:hypothetical protein
MLPAFRFPISDLLYGNTVNALKKIQAILDYPGAD